MKYLKAFFLLILFLIILPLNAHSQGFRRVRNTQSNLDFFINNGGVLFQNGAVAGLNWPRGTANSYVFGGGLWFGAKKYFPNPLGGVNPWTSLGSIHDSLTCICGNPFNKDLLVGSFRQNSIGNGVFLHSDTEKTWRSITIWKKLSVTSIVALPNGKDLIGADSGLFIGSEIIGWVPVIKATRTNPERITALSNYGIASSVIRNSPTNIYTPDVSWTTWTLRHSFTGVGPIKSISSLPGNALIIASTSYRIWMSKDTGTTWDSIPIPSNSGVTGVMLSASDNSIFTATVNEGVFQSFDQGSTWTPHNTGLNDLRTTALESSDGNTFALGTKSGVFTLPYGFQKNSAWIDRSAGIPGTVSVYSLDIGKDGGLHVILSDKRIFTTWSITVQKPGYFEVCELGYNPNTGLGWFSPGENISFKDGTDVNGKYYPYVSASFDRITGLPKLQDSVTPQYRWPVWSSANDIGKIKTNFNFGSRISNTNSRDSLYTTGAKPVFISQEDILNTYSDFDSSANPEFQSGTGYPLGLNIQESIYSWGFGRYRDLIYVRYKITNSSRDTLRECYLAPAIDPDLGVGGTAAGNDFNSYFGLTPQDSLDCRNFFPLTSPFHDDPTALNLCRQSTRTESTAVPAGEYGCIGFEFVESPIVEFGKLIQSNDSSALQGYGTNSLYKKNQLGLTSFRQWTISNDPQNTPQRYDFIGSGFKDHDNTIIADMRLLMSTGPFTLLPDSSVTMTLAIGIARPSTTVLKENQDSLLKLMAFAHDFFAHPVSESGDPNSVTIHHFEGAPTVSVKNIPPIPTFDYSFSPNPVSNEATISYLLQKRSIVKIEILNILGKQIAAISSGIEDAGSHTKTTHLLAMQSGSYFIRFTIDGINSIKRIQVLH